MFQWGGVAARARGIKESMRRRGIPFSTKTDQQVSVCAWQQYRWQFTRPLTRTSTREKRFSTRKRKSARQGRRVCHRVEVWNATLSTQSTREGGLVVPFNFKHRCNPPPSQPQRQRLLIRHKVRGVSRQRFHHHLEIYHATLYSLPPPICPLFIAQRLNVDAWKVGRERSYRKLHPLPRPVRRTRKSSSPSVPIFPFSFSFSLFFVGERQCRWQIFTMAVGMGEGEGIDPRPDFKFFQRTSHERVKSCNEAWITRTSGPRGARMHTQCCPSRRI